MSGTHETVRDHGIQKSSSDRAFGVVFAVVFSIIAAFQLWFGRVEWAIGLGAISLFFLLFARFAPKTLAPLNKAWMMVGLVLHKITNPIVLGSIYFLVFMPMGVVMRVFGYDPLRTKRSRDQESYWLERDPPGPASDSMGNQF